MVRRPAVVFRECEGVHEVFGLKEPTPEDAVLSPPGNLTASTSGSRTAHL